MLSDEFLDRYMTWAVFYVLTLGIFAEEQHVDANGAPWWLHTAWCVAMAFTIANVIVLSVLSWRYVAKQRRL